jgi:hypothetical protein
MKRVLPHHLSGKDCMHWSQILGLVAGSAIVAFFREWSLRRKKPDPDA